MQNSKGLGVEWLLLDPSHQEKRQLLEKVQDEISHMLDIDFSLLDLLKQLLHHETRMHRFCGEYPPQISSRLQKNSSTSRELHQAYAQLGNLALKIKNMLGRVIVLTTFDFRVVSFGSRVSKALKNPVLKTHMANRPHLSPENIEQFVQNGFSYPSQQADKCNGDPRKQLLLHLNDERVQHFKDCRDEATLLSKLDTMLDEQLMKATELLSSLQFILFYSVQIDQKRNYTFYNVSSLKISATIHFFHKAPPGIWRAFIGVDNREMQCFRVMGVDVLRKDKALYQQNQIFEIPYSDILKALHSMPDVLTQKFYGDGISISISYAAKSELSYSTSVSFTIKSRAGAHLPINKCSLSIISSKISLERLESGELKRTPLDEQLVAYAKDRLFENQMDIPRQIMLGAERHSHDKLRIISYGYSNHTPFSLVIVGNTVMIISILRSLYQDIFSFLEAKFGSYGKELKSNTKPVISQILIDLARDLIFSDLDSDRPKGFNIEYRTRMTGRDYSDFGGNWGYTHVRREDKRYDIPIWNHLYKNTNNNIPTHDVFISGRWTDEYGHEEYEITLCFRPIHRMRYSSESPYETEKEPVMLTFSILPDYAWIVGQSILSQPSLMVDIFKRYAPRYCYSPNDYTSGRVKLKDTMFNVDGKDYFDLSKLKMYDKNACMLEPAPRFGCNWT
ncbi:hypothetical protein HZB01_04025 [Candidatus Woesearchaeota archaeon]|nr:hypothetical protein [Candidatus Woesearchaeota archaeon]